MSAAISTWESNLSRDMELFYHVVVKTHCSTGKFFDDEGDDEHDDGDGNDDIEDNKDNDDFGVNKC